MSSLEPGRYHIKSQLSGLYFTALPSPGFLVAQPEKGEPFEFRPAGPHFAIYLYGLPIGIGDDKVVLQTETLWRVTKVEGQDAWV
ncbi:hypothetical protein P875_00064695 [Aspergillus parasiticus SU-1]|uniref:Uncharacterized protein n=1 Tax=Aspergillus parasiticus (strain ATCC 56775 / NRRL 5862 / SRRC 143 / SU-1) TaxID=1403190 RepID=A0A0F0I7S5_ASPPU|nr:hypothetical protein P875_00064695 [Aspergillus parasiticus SU-1]